MKIPFLMMVTFAMAALSVLFIIADPVGSWVHWVTAGFFIGIGIAMVEGV